MTMNIVLAGVLGVLLVLYMLRRRNRLHSED